MDKYFLYARVWCWIMLNRWVEDKKRPDLGNHDEVAERVLMQAKMDARRKAELKLERLRLMRTLCTDF